MSVFCIAFVLPNLLISFKTSTSRIKCISNSWYTWMISKVHYYFQSRMRDTFSWKTNIFEFRNFQVFYHIRKKTNFVSRRFHHRILSSSTNVVFFRRFYLIKKKRFHNFSEPLMEPLIYGTGSLVPSLSSLNLCQPPKINIDKVGMNTGLSK